mmetsp:Transcript_92658/g.220472  ORF Transcript_92658/g.220472 Transcript_92658/m.220472 type:complete len:182 (-) Transcript_92658:65-610(-)
MDCPMPALPPGLDRADPFGQKKSTLFAGTFRPQRSHVAKLAAAASLQKLGVQASPTPQGVGGSRPVTGTLSRPATGSTLDDMWDSLAVLSLRDRVSNLLQQPLPTRGEGIKEYARESSVGPLPVPPIHLSQTPSEAHGNFTIDQLVGVRDQQASEQWRGFRKNDQSDFNEARVHMGHIMRK